MYYNIEFYNIWEKLFALILIGLVTFEGKLCANI